MFYLPWFFLVLHCLVLYCIQMLSLSSLVPSVGRDVIGIAFVSVFLLTANLFFFMVKFSQFEFDNEYG